MIGVNNLNIESAFAALRAAESTHDSSTYLALVSELGIPSSEIDYDLASLGIADKITSKRRIEKNRLGQVVFTTLRLLDPREVIPGNHWNSEVGRLLRSALQHGDGGLDALVGIEAEVRTPGGQVREIAATYSFEDAQARDVVATYDYCEPTGDPFSAAIAYLRTFLPYIKIEGKNAVIRGKPSIS